MNHKTSYTSYKSEQVLLIFSIQYPMRGERKIKVLSVQDKNTIQCTVHVRHLDIKQKYAITQKLLVGISSNFLHSIRTSICVSENIIKMGG